jgi:hypothetical protein
MPFKSKAQRRKFAELLVKGEITPETYEEWNRETGRAELPERVKPKAKPRKRRKTTKRKPAKRVAASRTRKKSRRRKPPVRRKATGRKKK